MILKYHNAVAWFFPFTEKQAACPNDDNQPSTQIKQN